MKRLHKEWCADGKKTCNPPCGPGYICINGQCQEDITPPVSEIPNDATDDKK